MTDEISTQDILERAFQEFTGDASARIADYAPSLVPQLLAIAVATSHLMTAPILFYRACMRYQVLNDPAYNKMPHRVAYLDRLSSVEGVIALDLIWMHSPHIDKAWMKQQGFNQALVDVNANAIAMYLWSINDALAMGESQNKYQTQLRRIKEAAIALGFATLGPRRGMGEDIIGSESLHLFNLRVKPIVAGMMSQLMFGGRKSGSDDE